MTHIENIKAGDWAVVVGRAPCRECGQDHDADGYAGTPLKVLAVEVPFLLLRCLDGTASGLDVRVWRVKKVLNRRYVRAWLDAGGDHEKREDDRQCDAPPRCVKCGERLRETKIGRRGWRWLCPTQDCGYDGGPVEA